MSSPGEYALDNELCSRCGNIIDPKAWHDNWPNYGRIELGFAAQAFAALCGATSAADTEHYKAWEVGHKAMIRDEAQGVVLQWGRGYTYTSHKGYIICYKCQKELLGLVGEFFDYGEYYSKKKLDTASE